MKKVVLYIRETAPIGGIETFIYNFCEHMHSMYDIVLATDKIYEPQLRRLPKEIKIRSLSEINGTECDTLVMLRVTDPIPKGVKYQKVIRRIHTRKFYDIQNIPDDSDISVCVSQSVKDDWQLKNSIVINSLYSKPKSPSLLLVSATRIPAYDKGDNEARMRTLANMLNKANIPFLWLNFSDRVMLDSPMNFYNISEGRLDVQNFMKRADYIVQLSTVEALSNTVIEALALNVPLICTPVPCFFELGVKDGVNAHVVPFDMEFDVHKLLEIPKYEYRYDNDRIIEQWKGIL